jgi:hypothetical protein
MMETLFGDWIYNLKELHTQFISAQPFEHVVIPNFFNETFANKIEDSFPEVDTSKWHHYHNPIEHKYALNKFDDLPIIQQAFEVFQSNIIVDALQIVTGISNLESDPLLHGAGLHAYPHKGKLDMHLDYSVHPITGKERRCNLIVYMNKHWKNEYGGQLCMWNVDKTTCSKVTTPSWNTAVLFRTSDISYHGLPTPLQCPKGEFRKSLAVYYVSDQRQGTTVRHKAEFFPQHLQPVSTQLQSLYDIRKTRLITKDDLSHWPNWELEGNGFW